MKLSSPWLVVLLFLLALAPLGVLIWRLESWRTSRRGRWVMVATIVVAQLAMVLPTAAAINDAFAFYPAWSDLLGRAGTISQRKVPPRGELENKALAALAAAQAGHGAIVGTTFVNPATGLSTGSLVYFPAAYRKDRLKRFPVIVMVNGYPGSARSYTQNFGIGGVLDEEIRAGRMAPTIAVIPNAEVTPPRDTECVDVPGGPAVETLLGPILKAAIVKEVRARAERSAWGTLGYSTGAFCAVQLLLHHPDLYSTAVSMSGYFTAPRDITTGDLYGSDANRNYNSPLWFIHNVPLTLPVSILLATGGKEKESFAAAQVFKANPPAGLTFDQIRNATGGHSFRMWRLLMPTCLDWMSAHLSGAVAPTPRQGR